MYLIMVANGALLLLVVGLKQVAQDFGWPRGVPSLAYAFLFIGTGVGGIVMGYSGTTDPVRDPSPRSGPS